MKRPARAFDAARRLAFVAALLLPALGLARAEPLTLAVSRGPVSLPVYVAEARGWFAAEGVDVRLADCSSGMACVQQLAEQQADVATAAELPVVLDAFRGARLVVLATLAASSAQVKVVLRRGVVPQRIGTVLGSSAQYQADRWLLYSGVDPAGVALQSYPPDALPGALRRREVDAISIWEPYASQALAELGAEAETGAGASVYTQHFGLVAMRQLAAARAADLRALLRALLRAQRSIEEDPQAADALLARKLGSAAPAAGARPDYRVRLDQSLITTMESQARWAQRSGLVDAALPRPDLSRSIDATLLRQVAPNAVGLVN